MQMQEIKTKMKHTSLAERNAERNPRGGEKPAGKAGWRGAIRSSIDWLAFCKSQPRILF